MAGLTPDERQRRRSVRRVPRGCESLGDFTCWREDCRSERHGARSTRTPASVVADRGVPIARDIPCFSSSWYLIHANPAVARVLLGMSTSGVAAYRELGVADLTHIARRHPEWVRPRWADRLDVWTVILEGCGRRGEQDPRSLTLRCLQVSAGTSSGCPPMLSSRHDAALRMPLSRNRKKHRRCREVALAKGRTDAGIPTGLSSNSTRTPIAAQSAVIAGDRFTGERGGAKLTTRHAVGDKTKKRAIALDEILWMRDVVQLTGKHRSTIHRWMHQGIFPRKMHREAVPRGGCAPRSSNGCWVRHRPQGEECKRDASLR